MHRLTSRIAKSTEGEGQPPEETAADGIGLLYERYLDDVFGYVLHRVSNYTEAEDITAETFAAALGAFSRFRGESGEFTWLLSIARQKIAESARRREARQFREVPEVDLTPEQRRMLELLLEVDIGQLPEDAALRMEAQKMMRKLLAGLPEHQREALLLQAEYRLPVREIARVLGRTETATYSLLQRGREAIFRRGQHYFKQ